MYTNIKRFVLSFIPKSFLVRYEPIIRYFISLPYRGSTYQCNVCSMSLRKFVSLPSNDKLCPRCGSRSRGRRLHKYLFENKLLKGTVLHFSPPIYLYNRLKNLEDLTYYATDFENEFIADYQFDLTKISLPDNSIDLIICYHILEHIDDDIQAMSEISRVLKTGGTAIIQTPYKEGSTYENPLMKTQSEREIAFGQKDHVRIYSVLDLSKRLQQVGLQVEVYNAEQIAYNGFREETILIASI